LHLLYAHPTKHSIAKRDSLKPIQAKTKPAS
jgi:hypothetical protein